MTEPKSSTMRNEEAEKILMPCVRIPRLAYIWRLAHGSQSSSLFFVKSLACITHENSFRWMVDSELESEDPLIRTNGGS